MTKRKLIITLLVALTFSVNFSIYGQTKVFIPDENFRAFLNTNYPSFMDSSGDSLITEMAASLTGLFICPNENISDLSGIEYFTSITQLLCYYNQLTTLPDLSSLTELIALSCGDNQLTSLSDLSNNSKLLFLACDNNQLTSLPSLSANTVLYYLCCSDNHLTSLPDLSANKALEELNCSNNELTALPSLLTNTELQKLDCYSNVLASLPDLSANTQLTRLDCSSNQLTDLGDLSMNTNLKVLLCLNNQLTSLPDLSTNTELLQLGCFENQLSKLPDLSNNTALQEIWCSDNQLIEMPDLSNHTALWFVDCYSNRLDFSDARTLRIIDNLPNMLSFDYSPQNPFDSSYTISLFVGEDMELHISDQDSALSYQWFKDDVTIDGANDTILNIPNTTYSDSGVYTCKSMGTALQSPPMNFTPGISEFISEPIHVNISAVAEVNGPTLYSSISIYPNPNNGIFKISFNILQEEYKELKIYGSLGQTILIEKLQQLNGTYIRELNLKEYSKGIYLLQLTGDRKRINKIIIVE